MHNCFKRSELEPRGPKNGLKLGPRSSRWVQSAQCLCMSRIRRPKRDSRVSEVANMRNPGALAHARAQ
eukprot:1890491-Alexandrium_andersonii.AAC.1